MVVHSTCNKPTAVKKPRKKYKRHKVDPSQDGGFLDALIGGLGKNLIGGIASSIFGGSSNDNDNNNNNQAALQMQQ